MDSKNKTYGYILLENIGREVDVLACPFGRLSMDALCMGLAADVVRTANYFKEALAAWRQCLPLGETFDVNYSLWGEKIWSWLRQVAACFQDKGAVVIGTGTWVLGAAEPVSFAPTLSHYIHQFDTGAGTWVYPDASPRDYHINTIVLVPG